MSKGKTSEGESLYVTLAADAAANDIVVQGNIVGVAQEAGSSGDSILIHLEGTWSPVPKTTGTAWTVGQKLYWKASTSKLTTVSTDGVFAGVAWAAAASGDTTGEILLVCCPAPLQMSRTTETIASGTLTKADPRITATSHVQPVWLTNTTKSGNFKVTLDPGVGYTIDVTKDTDTTTETGAAGTVSVLIVY